MYSISVSPSFLLLLLLLLPLMFSSSRPFMRLAEHLTFQLRAWCKQSISAWSVETPHAPSRHCRDAGVYGHAPPAMHGMSTPLTLFTPPLVTFVFFLLPTLGAPPRTVTPLPVRRLRLGGGVVLHSNTYLVVIRRFNPLSPYVHAPYVVLITINIFPRANFERKGVGRFLGRLHCRG